MTVEDRIQELLEELMERECSPEEACAQSPELLVEVRKRWIHLQCVEHQLGLFFPTSIRSAWGDSVSTGETGISKLPRIDGYDVESLLGHGGMGVVYRARHLKLNRTVALKMLLHGAYAGPQELIRFQREAEAVASLSHPNIVQIYDFGDLDDRPFFTMEFMEGPSLSEALSGAPQPAQNSAAFVAILAMAVQVAHEGGIIHRDLKPANVLLTADGTPKITDFGLARRFAGESDLTMTGARIGTPSYMAPEQAAGLTSSIGPAADIYALGAILYEMLTGRPPFRAETAIETERQVVDEEPVSPRRLNSKVPRDLETICLKCLHKDPRRRYPTAAALADDLQRFQRGEPIKARRVSVLEHTFKWANRHRSLTAAIGSSMLLAISLLAFAWSWMLDKAVIQREMEGDFVEVVRAQRQLSWSEARMALERAKARLGDRQAVDLRARIEKYGNELELVKTFDDIRMTRLTPGGNDDKRATADAAYEAAFTKAGLFELNEPTIAIAKKIRATGIARALLVALDDWAGIAIEYSRQKWLLDVARQVDDAPTNSPIRDPSLWSNRDALNELFRDVSITEQSLSLLIDTGERLRSLGGDPVPLFKRIQQEYPSDFWANLTLGNALRAAGNPQEAIRFFQAAIAVRPTVPAPHNNLGTALTDCARIEEALEQFRIATRLEPESALYRFNFALAFYRFGRYEEAVRELSLVSDQGPISARCRSLTGYCLAGQKKFTEAIASHRRALELDDHLWEAHRGLRTCLLQLNRLEDARIVWKRATDLQPPDHESWDGYAELCLYLGYVDDYRLACRSLLNRFGDSGDPQIAERTGRACLFLPVTLEELIAPTHLIDRALSADPARYAGFMSYFRIAKALAEYRADRLENTRVLLDEKALRILGPAPRLLLAMTLFRQGQPDVARANLVAAIGGFDWNPEKANDREAWMYHLLRREAEKLIHPGEPSASTK